MLPWQPPVAWPTAEPAVRRLHLIAPRTPVPRAARLGRAERCACSCRRLGWIGVPTHNRADAQPYRDSGRPPPAHFCRRGEGLVRTSQQRLAAGHPRGRRIGAVCRSSCHGWRSDCCAGGGQGVPEPRGAHGLDVSTCLGREYRSRNALWGGCPAALRRSRQAQPL